MNEIYFQSGFPVSLYLQDAGKSKVAGTPLHVVVVPSLIMLIRWHWRKTAQLFKAKSRGICSTGPCMFFKKRFLVNQVLQARL